MGETFEEIINLIILDIFQSITEKTNGGNLKTPQLAKLFHIAILSSGLGTTDTDIINIITSHLQLIFGINKNDCNVFIFNLFTNEKKYILTLKLISILRKSNIILVKL